MFIKTFVFVSAIAVVLSSSLIRNKREAYVLPDGLEYIPQVNPSFTCSAPGYFADVDNDCQLFHVCINQEFPDGKQELAQYTFACGNQTVFNQFSMTCAHPSESIPCASSSEFFFLNERLGNEKALLHEDADVEKAAALLTKSAN